jgi:hypothetical protein
MADWTVDSRRAGAKSITASLDTVQEEVTTEIAD